MFRHSTFALLFELDRLSICLERLVDTAVLDRWACIVRTDLTTDYHRRWQAALLTIRNVWKTWHASLIVIWLFVVLDRAVENANPVSTGKIVHTLKVRVAIAAKGQLRLAGSWSLIFPFQIRKSLLVRWSRDFCTIIANFALRVIRATHFIDDLSRLTKTDLKITVFAGALIVLGAKSARQFVCDFLVRVDRASVQLNVAQLVITTRFDLDFKRVGNVLLIAENLFWHINTACMYCVAFELGASWWSVD